MADEQVDVGTPVASTPVETVSFANIIGEDGKFSADWKERINPDFKGEKCLDTFQDINEFVKQHVNLNRSFGKEKIVMPTEKSSPDEWNSFYSRIGRPETAEEYKFEKNPNVPVEMYDDALISSVLPQLYEAGFTQKQVDLLAQIEGNRIEQFTKMQQAYPVKQQEDTSKSLKAEWGNAYDQNLHMSTVALEKAVGGDTELKQRLVNKFGNDPDFIKMASKLGSLFSEHKIIRSDGTPVNTPKQAESKAKELMETQGYMTGELKKTNPATYQKITNEISNLYKEANIS